MVAAGDQGEAARSCGKQGAHLLLVAGVVQDEEDLPVGEETAEERAPVGGVFGDAQGGDAQGGEEAVQGATGVDGGCVRVESAQVDEELPVGERGGDAVRVVHGEGCFADTGSTADDHSGGSGGPGAARCTADGGQPRAFGRSSREHRQATRQLRRTCQGQRQGRGSPAVRDRCTTCVGLGFRVVGSVGGRAGRRGCLAPARRPGRGGPAPVAAVLGHRVGRPVGRVQGRQVMVEDALVQGA